MTPAQFATLEVGGRAIGKRDGVPVEGIIEQLTEWGAELRILRAGVGWCYQFHRIEELDFPESHEGCC